MNFTKQIIKQYKWNIAFGIICIALGFGGGVLANIDNQTIVRSFNDVTYEPMNPNRPDGTQWNILWGDPKTGPSAVIAKYKKSSGQLHSHSSDFHLVLLKGEIKYWSANQSEAQAKSMKEGSYLFQPGNVVHSESCITDECLVFMKWTGKKDTSFPEVK